MRSPLESSVWTPIDTLLMPASLNSLEIDYKLIDSDKNVTKVNLTNKI